MQIWNDDEFFSKFFFSSFFLRIRILRFTIYDYQARNLRFILILLLHKYMPMNQIYDTWKKKTETNLNLTSTNFEFFFQTEILDLSMQRK